VPGATSSLFYAQRLYLLPFSILSLSIVRGIVPRLNTLKNSSKKDFDILFNKGFKLHFTIFIPVILLSIICRNEITDIVFARGKFDYNSVLLTSDALLYYSIGLLPMGLSAYFLRVLSLFYKNKYGLYISIVGSISNILFAVIGVKYTNLSHGAIALAVSLSFFINAQLMWYYLKRELDIKVLKRDLFYIVTLLMLALIIYFADFYIGDFYKFKNFINNSVVILVKTIVVAILFFIPYKRVAK